MLGKGLWALNRERFLVSSLSISGQLYITFSCCGNMVHDGSMSELTEGRFQNANQGPEDGSKSWAVIVLHVEATVPGMM